MLKTLLSMVLVMSIAVGLVGAVNVRAQSYAPAPSALVGGEGDEMEEGRKCFGYGSENCCEELTALAIVAGGTGNVAALTVIAAALYTYNCL
jgi:hypothetical protein